MLCAPSRRAQRCAWFAFMRTYLDLLQHILTHGRRRPNRTGVDTIGVFGYQARFDLRAGFPLLTTKKMFFRGVAEELFWFLSGSTDARELQAKGVHIWDEWATAEQTARFGRGEGQLGPVYGHAWRNFGATYCDEMCGCRGTGAGPDGYHRNGFDQIKWLVAEILKSPQSRRLIVSGWHPVDAERVALPPCHTLFQFYVQDGELSCHLFQRSADAFLGVPFNIASYALLTHLIAYCTGLTVGDFVHTFGDLHIYENHMDQVREQLSREPRQSPRLRIDATTEAVASPDRAFKKLLSLGFENLLLDGYNPHPAIKADVAV